MRLTLSERALVWRNNHPRLLAAAFAALGCALAVPLPRWIALRLIHVAVGAAVIGLVCMVAWRGLLPAVLRAPELRRFRQSGGARTHLYGSVSSAITALLALAVASLAATLSPSTPEWMTYSTGGIALWAASSVDLVARNVRVLLRSVRLAVEPEDD